MQHQNGKKSVAPAAPLKRITRATENRLQSKAYVQDKEQKSQKKEQSIAPNNYQFKPPAGLHYMQLFGRVDLQSMLSPLRLSEIISTSRTRGASRKGESIELCSGQFNTTNHDLSLINKETDSNNEEDSSESVKLKLSSDEDEQPDSFRDSSQTGNTIATSDCKAEAENGVIDNNSPAEEAVLSPSDNKTTTPSPAEPIEPAFFSPYIVTSRGKSCIIIE